MTRSFWSKVNKHGPRAGRLGRCWVWTGTRDIGGYGRLAGRLAHRVAWGDVPDGLCVLHRCDNPPCVRRSHLFLGTRLDNAIDAKSKGRPLGRQTLAIQCPARHRYDEKNTYTWTRADGYRIRFCRACHRRQDRRRRAA